MEILEESVKNFSHAVAGVIEALAGLIISWSIIVAFFRYVRTVYLKEDNSVAIRIRLGKSLALSLEFLLAADIIQTAVAPTWDEIGKLAAIAALRTLLNYFLEREIEKNLPAEQERETH